jgi:hypothetical protein
MNHVKKIVLILATVTYMANISGAQNNNSGQDKSTDNRENLMFGLKAGVNYSNVYDAKGEEFKADPKLGMVAGIFLSVPIGKYLGVQPEILFSQKGFQAKGIILGSNYEFARTTTFIDVPLLITLKPVEFFSLMAGPQYSYLVKQRDEFAGSNLNVEQEQEFENKNLRKNILCFIGGFDINMSNLILSARVGWDIQHNNGDGTSTSPRYKNAWYQATIGLRF